MAHIEEIKASELAVLGAMIVDSNCGSLEIVGKVSCLLREEDFYNPNHQKIYGAILHLFEQKIPADLVLLTQELIDRNELSECGGASYLAQLDDRGFLLSNVEYHADRLRRGSERRQVQHLIGASLKDMEAGEDTGAVLSRLAALKALDAEVVVTGKNAAREAYDDLAKIQDGTKPPLVWTGYRDLDEYYAPAPGSLVVIGALTSVGKTALALGIAGNMVDRRSPVFFNSIEMVEGAIITRMFSKISRVEMPRMVRQGGMDQGDWQRMTDAASKVSGYPIFLGHSRNPYEIIKTAQKLQRENKIQAVFVDYLGLLDMPKSDRPDLRIAATMHLFQGLARDSGLVVYVLSQINRAVEHRDKKKPGLSDLSGSGAIEQDADLVYLLHRPYKGKPNDTEIAVRVAKNRNGSLGNVTLTFDKGHVR
jgi:replicative DNA helicase